ncbi:MAG: hypothetical protein IJ642_02440 [Oscillospiraceae bacterium]|nr:hypothetical protein [Oscillospiraceae bacterium]
MPDYTEAEIRAVRYYIGDVKQLPQDGFWNDPKAYCLLNALFFPELQAETARIAEGKFLNPELLADLPGLTDFFKHFFSVFRKSRAEQEFITYRVERFSDYEFMKKAGKTISFTSTSEAGFLKAYQDRKGIALLRFQIPEQTPCIRMQDFFRDYAKPEEAEILLPPGLKLHFEALELSETELNILDSEGNPPLLSCLVRAENVELIQQNQNAHVSEQGAKAGIRAISALQAGKIPSPEDVRLYADWKRIYISGILRNFL